MKIKVTALIPEDLLKYVIAFTKEETVTKGLIKALNSWMEIQKEIEFTKLCNQIKEKPLKIRKVRRDR